MAILLQKYVSLQRPISTRRITLVFKAWMASSGCKEIPRARLISLTVPMGINPNLARPPARTIPFTVSLMVPSPPIQKMASTPSLEASMANCVASPAWRVNFTSIRSNKELSCHCSSITYRRALPPPDTGLIIIKQRLMVDSYSIYT